MTRCLDATFVSLAVATMVFIIVSIVFLSAGFGVKDYLGFYTFITVPPIIVTYLRYCFLDENETSIVRAIKKKLRRRK